ncbi:MAG: hypothetical protein WED34_20585 [Planctomycetales bacterium]
MPTADVPTCRHCARPLAGEETVRLWDGRDYCRACVEAEMPGLAEYAAGHPRLEEFEPLERNHIRSRLLDWARGVSVAALFLGIIPGLCAGVVEYRSTGQVVESVSWAFYFAGAAVLLVLPPLAASILRGSRTASVVAEEGRVESVQTNRDGHRRGDPARNAPIDTIRWLVGRRASRNILGRDDVVMLAFPDQAKRLKLFPARPAAICGWTDDTRRRWVAFLRLAGAHCLRPISARED